MRRRALTIYAENEEEYKKVKQRITQEMERNDILLEKEKERLTDRSRRSKLTEKIEEYKTLSLFRIDELSSENSYQVYLIK
jgi:hypothetical protein